MKELIPILIIVALFLPAGLWAGEGCCPSGKTASACAWKSPGSSKKCPAGGACATPADSTKKAALAVDPSEKAAEATINTPGLSALLKSRVPLTVLDARSAKFDDGKRIPGARTLSPDSLPGEIRRLIPDKSSLVVTYCANLKCPASHKLSLHLRSLGYTNVIEYPEGIQGWVESGLPVSTAKR